MHFARAACFEFLVCAFKDPSPDCFDARLSNTLRCDRTRVQLEVAPVKIMFDLSTNVRDHVQKVVEVVDDSL
jgi:hypothetical protein